MENPLFGVILHVVGALAAGSFYVFFARIRNWVWESYWLIFNLVAYLIVPFGVAFFVTPKFLDILQSSPPRTLLSVFTLGLIWGIGGFAFGLSLRYLGISLGMAISLGFCTAIGTVVPPIIEGRFFALFTSVGGISTLSSIMVCLIGIAMTGWAGILKDRQLSFQLKAEAIREFSLKRGLLAALTAGAMSSANAIGFEIGKPIGEIAVGMNVYPTFRNTPLLILLMSGNCVSNILVCLFMNYRNRSFRDYRPQLRFYWFANIVLASIAGFVAYNEFFWYGMGTTFMGAFDFSSWSIHLALVILVSSIWGIAFNEWKGVRKKVWFLLMCGLALLVVSTLVTALSGTIEGYFA